MAVARCARCEGRGYISGKGFMNLFPCPSCWKSEIKREMKALFEDPTYALLDMEAAERQLNQLSQLLCGERPYPRFQFEGFGRIRPIFQIVHPLTFRKITLEEFFTYLDEEE